MGRRGGGGAETLYDSSSSVGGRKAQGGLARKKRGLFGQRGEATISKGGQIIYAGEFLGSGWESFFCEGPIKKGPFAQILHLLGKRESLSGAGGQVNISAALKARARREKGKLFRKGEDLS